MRLLLCFLIVFFKSICYNMDMREIVFDAFRRTNSRAGHILFLRAFRAGIMRRMNPEEQKGFVNTLNSLITEGLIQYESGDDGMDLIRLTEKGYEQLYQRKPDHEIAEMLMNEFRRLNYRVGQSVPMRNLNHNLIPRLNPKEQDQFVRVVNELIKNEYIAYDSGETGSPIEGLRLCSRGYDHIYKSSPPDLRELFGE